MSIEQVLCRLAVGGMGDLQGLQQARQTPQQAVRELPILAAGCLPAEGAARLYRQLRTC